MTNEIQEMIDDIREYTKNFTFVDYFGDKIIQKEYEKISSENTKICKKILNHEEVDPIEIALLTYLPLKVAKVLIKNYKNDPILNLNDLKSLDAPTAKVIAKFKGILLLLNDLQFLDTPIKKALVEFKGSISYMNGEKLLHGPYDKFLDSTKLTDAQKSL